MIVPEILSLSGGGSHGSWQVGFLEFMANYGLLRKVRGIYGVSVGSVTGAALASGRTVEEGFWFARRLWDQFSTKDVYEHWWLPYIAALWKSGLHSTAPLRRMLEAHLNIDALRESPTAFYAGALDAQGGEYVLIPKTDPDILDGIMASAALPGWMEAVMFRGTPHVDGGVRNTLHAIRMTSGIPTLGLLAYKRRKHDRIGKPLAMRTIPIAQRVFGHLFDEIVEGDLDLFETAGPRVASPSQGLGFGAMDFSQEGIQHGIALGYQDAEAFFGGFKDGSEHS
jgi:predicted patatin/cPLA2 family phospholipase